MRTAMLLLVGLSLPLCAEAGGIFGNSGLLGFAPNALDGSGDAFEPAPDELGPEEPGLNTGDSVILLPAPSTAPSTAPTSDVQSAFRKLDRRPIGAPLPQQAAPSTFLDYTELLEGKSSAQRQFEAEQAEELGVAVSNICLTAAGACEVSYTTQGSTCYCDNETTFELGIVQ
ncbi:MAG: hypothetical protein BM562_16060 [Alphaproteobacteria bacterium MedPE-SWcel]|nr:MAG: hypothetical protein BM562_16060 [Alphaproteobacteria bacterium MedPE-SWcel]